MTAKRRTVGSLADIRKITRVGIYAYCITIPKNIISELRWRERQRVVVSLEGDAIVIRDYKPGK